MAKNSKSSFLIFGIVFLVAIGVGVIVYRGNLGGLKSLKSETIQDIINSICNGYREEYRKNEANIVQYIKDKGGIINKINDCRKTPGCEPSFGNSSSEWSLLQDTLAAHDRALTHADQNRVRILKDLKNKGCSLSEGTPPGVTTTPPTATSPPPVIDNNAPTFTTPPEYPGSTPPPTTPSP